jgi:hypothetical protein
VRDYLCRSLIIIIIILLIHVIFIRTIWYKYNFLMKDKTFNKFKKHILTVAELNYPDIRKRKYHFTKITLSK